MKYLLFFRRKPVFLLKTTQIHIIIFKSIAETFA